MAFKDKTPIVKHFMRCICCGRLMGQHRGGTVHDNHLIDVRIQTIKPGVMGGISWSKRDLTPEEVRDYKTVLRAILDRLENLESA